MIEMIKLITLLDANKVPYEINTQLLTGTLQVCYPNKQNVICDAVCHKYSYGYKQGLLEIMGLVDDDIEDSVQGYLTGEQVFLKMFINHYKIKPSF